MNVIKTKIEDLFILEPKVFHDERGYFFESYNEKVFADLGINYHFVQDNCSFSKKGTIRGLHFQKEPFAQAKLVKVLQGKVLDVAVDLRKDSKTFGKHVAVELSSENFRQFLIPRGFAHGFAVLSSTALFSYKCDNFYEKSAEAGIRFDDPELGIDWKIDPASTIISEKDRNNMSFREFCKCC